jgi:hypothetical protein
MKKKMTLGVCLLAVLAAPALAILGLGDIVFDPTSYGELVNQLVQMEQQYVQLVQTYQTIQNQYNQMLFMARQVPVNMIARYRALATPWVNSSATNIYGTTGAWTSGINTGTGVPGGYSAATVALGTYGAGIGNIPADQLDRLKTGYATVELTDGANLSGMATLGSLRANAPAAEIAIQNLENDSLSSDPNMNTEVAVLNKISVANVIGLRNGQDTNKLLGALAEEQIIAAKRRRDAEAQAFNEHIAFVNQGQAILASQASGASSAMLAWRMP